MQKRSDQRRKKQRSTYAKKLGAEPGSLVHVGEIKVEAPDITLFDYGPAELIEVTFASIDESRAYKKANQLLWLNVHGVHDVKVMETIGARFGLHPLVLEDIVNTQQRPKLEDYGDYLFIVLRTFNYNAERHDATSDQISLVLGHDFVLSFQERPSGLFNPIRMRLRKNECILRKQGSDALLHALIDAIVDRYFVIVEAIADDVELLEDVLIEGTNQHAIKDINHFKRETVEVRRAIWPTREVLNALQRQQGTFLTAETHLFFRDVYDHTVHVIEQIEALRDQIGDLLDIHLSTISNRMNAEIRVLTVVTTMLAPAALVTGFFGMNFHFIPLLDKSDGWLISLAIIGTAALVLVAILYWQRWWVKRKG